MLDCEVKNGWTQFLEFIESRCSSAEFQNWISPIRLVEATPEKILLEVPNVYVQDYLLDNFKEVLCNFLPLLSSGEPAIQFLISSEKPTATAIAAPAEAQEETTPSFEL